MSKQPTTPNMQSRCTERDYSAPGIYHITLVVTESLGQPLGRVVGDIHQEDGQPNAPHVELSPIGKSPIKSESFISAEYTISSSRDVSIIASESYSVLHCKF